MITVAPDTDEGLSIMANDKNDKYTRDNKIALAISVLLAIVGIFYVVKMFRHSLWNGIVNWIVGIVLISYVAFMLFCMIVIILGGKKREKPNKKPRPARNKGNNIMANFFKKLFGNDKPAKNEPVDKEGKEMNEMPTKNESVEKEEEAKHNQEVEVEVEKEESELPRPDSTKEETMATGRWALKGNELVDMDGNHVAYADKESSHAALFLNQHLLVYENNYIILDDITRIYHYERSYSGDGTTDITDKTILVTGGKKKVYDYSYEKHAGPSWDDYADVMESDDNEEFYIETQDRKYKVEFDYKVWGWLLEYFPSEEENK